MVRKSLVASLSALALLVGIGIAKAQEAQPSGNTSESALSRESIDAGEILPGQTIFYGRVNLLPEGAKPGEWEIAGRRVRVSDTTKLEFKGRSLRVGNRVDVIGQYEGRYFHADVIRRR